MTSLKRITKSAVTRMLAASWRSPSLRSLLEQFVLERLTDSFPARRKVKWANLDRVFTATRRQLQSTRRWRYGTNFVKAVATRTHHELTRYRPIEGHSYCDVGCGRYHPYGVSAVMYINGAVSTIAVDVKKAEPTRAAEALYDLLVDCLAHPGDWRLSSVSEDEYFERIRRFNLKALRIGDLTGGLSDTPLRYVIGDIQDVGIQPGSIDLMSSTAVLEHFLNFESATRRLFDLMSPGGIACHAIDLMDHRMYGQSEKYQWWSFLAEDENWSDNVTNRLRSSEIRKLLEKAGFELLRFDGTEKGDLPANFRRHFKGRFSAMSEEELRITRVDCVLRKPADKTATPRSHSR